MNAHYDTTCSKSELELFATPPVNISMEKGDVIAHRPVSSVTENAPIEFHIAGSPEEYIDLGRTELYVKLKVLNTDDTVLAADAQASLVNLALHSIFSQVDVKFRDTLVTPSVNTYPYKSYLETHLGFSESAKNDLKSKEGYYADTSEEQDAVNPETTENRGLQDRAVLIATSASVELIGRPHVDILQQDKYLIPGVDMHFKFIRGNDSFALMGDVNRKIRIQEAILYVRKVKVNPTIALEHAKMLDQGQMAKYPLRRGVVTTFTVPRGDHNFSKENVISGQLPRRVVIGLIGNDAFNGARDKNPFNFQHYNLNFLSLSTGFQSFPVQPLRPDYEANNYLIAYNSLITGVGLSNGDRSVGITRHNYTHGNVLYAFDMTADMAEGAHVDPIRHGNLRIEAGFGAALPTPVTVVVYAEYENMIQIDRARNIVTDF